MTVVALSVLAGLLAVLLLVPAGRASAATYRVTMQGYAFSPATLTVPAGSTVTWTNQDTAPHDVKTTWAPAAFHSPMLNKGGSWSYTFTTPGTYAYVCTVHPNMTARIVVSRPTPTRSASPTPTPTPTPAAAPQTQATAATSRPLDPLLILTGLVAGVAVLCLLLVGSRASRDREEDA